MAQARAGRTNPQPNHLSVLPDDEEADSKPLDFDTFVPTHDPSLNMPTFEEPLPVPGPDYSSYYLPTPPGPMVSKDEAFRRALGAMYWGGYWTAVYQCQSTAGSRKPETQDQEVEVEFEGEAEENEDLVSTQRDPL